MRNLEEFNKKHENNPCFIIGAGCSVAFEDLSLLKNQITIAVNSGYVGYTDASFFLSDDWAAKNWSYMFEDLKKTSTIALLYENKLGSSAEWFGNRSVLFRHKKGYELNSIYSHSKSSEHIWESRTSVGSSIHVAHIMGCSPIYLLGIDCCRYQGYRYFWQMKGFKKPFRNDGIPIDTFKRTINKGIESDIDLNSIKAYWIRVKDKFLEKKIQIFNISNITVLDVFPRITLKEAVSG